MKHQAIMSVILVSAALAVGCKPSEEKTLSVKGETSAQQIDKMSKDAKELSLDLKEYAYSQKAEFVEKMKSQVTELNAELEKLSAKVANASDAAKSEAKPKLEALRVQVAGLNKQLDDAKNATESTWNDVKSGFQKGYIELKDGFNQARQWVSDKIAP